MTSVLHIFTFVTLTAITPHATVDDGNKILQSLRFNPRPASWVPGTDPCRSPRWKYITCWGNYVNFIDTNRTKVYGTIDLTKLPTKMRVLNLISAQVGGSVDLGSLPQNLTVLLLINNQLMGTNVNLENLPTRLLAFDISVNHITAEFKADKLPRGMRHLGAAHCQIKGSLDMTKLPEHLVRLYLANNTMSGELDFTTKPLSSLQVLSIAGNNFTGPLDLSKMLTTMPRLVTLAIFLNQLTGSLELTKLPVNLTRFYAHYNKFSGPSNFASLPKRIRYFNVAHNLLEGTVDAKALPIGIVSFQVSINKLHGDLPYRGLEKHTSLMGMSLFDNKFTAPPGIDQMVFNEFGPRMVHFDAALNQLKGIIGPLSHLSESLRFFAIDNNSLHGWVNLSQLNKSVQYLYIKQKEDTLCFKPEYNLQTEIFDKSEICKIHPSYCGTDVPIDYVKKHTTCKKNNNNKNSSSTKKKSSLILILAAIVGAALLACCAAGLFIAYKKRSKQRLEGDSNYRAFSPNRSDTEADQELYDKK